MYEFTEENNNKRFMGSAEDYKFKINGQTENLEEVMNERERQEVSEGLQKYMPIGSVISLSDSDELLMIIGFNYNYNDKIYDYIGCCYPYGLCNSHQTKIFNHEQIKKIYNVGYINNQEKVFKAELRNNGDENVNLRRR